MRGSNRRRIAITNMRPIMLRGCESIQKFSDQHPLIVDIVNFEHYILC